MHKTVSFGSKIDVFATKIDRSVAKPAPETAYVGHKTGAFAPKTHASQQSYDDFSSEATGSRGPHARFALTSARSGA